MNTRKSTTASPRLSAKELEEWQRIIIKFYESDIFNKFKLCEELKIDFDHYIQADLYNGQLSAHELSLLTQFAARLKGNTTSFLIRKQIPFNYTKFAPHE